MQTSYFAKYKGENGISIARFSPKGYKGNEYKELAPPYWLLQRYKKNKNKEFYIKNYYKYVLDKLDAREVYEELGENAVLLCYEKSGNFCHRYLVAEWFENELGVKVTEVEY